MNRADRILPPPSIDAARYDVRGGPASRPLPDGVRALPWPHVDEGGRRADAERPEQKLELLH